jgi:hypothetical protein
MLLSNLIAPLAIRALNLDANSADHGSPSAFATHPSQVYFCTADASFPNCTCSS